MYDVHMMNRVDLNRKEVSKMQLGFTGTQRGMTEDQHVAVESLMRVLDIGHVHHGDCVGADADFHELAEARNARIEIHPPFDSEKRAWCKGDILWPEYDYMKRNQHIVDCSDVLIATPGEMSEVLRSGTWSTIRRARQKGIRIFIVTPDGHINEEGQ